MTFIPLNEQPRHVERYHRQDQQQREEHDENFRFVIPLLESEDDGAPDESDNSTTLSVPRETIDRFQKDGFAVFPEVLSSEAVESLNDRLEDVLRGVYDRGRKPDKIPRLVKGHKPQPLHKKVPIDQPPPSASASASASIEQTTTTPATTEEPTPINSKRGQNKKKKASTGGNIGPIGFSGNLQNVKVLQIINIHKADSLFRKLETSPSLANIVSKLAGWDHFGGARLAQDQFWGKPPGAPPLVFHRDTPYFMFEPSEVVTVWVALDDMDPELGPLEYVVGSHRWGDGRVGSASQFFQADTTSLLRSAAEREGIGLSSLEFCSMGGLRRGGISIHHGKIWHGSAKNSSTSKPRRGLGLHFVPAGVRFTAEASKSRLWKSYVADVDDPSTVKLSEEDFPLSV